MTVIRVRPKDLELQAMRLTIGKTTKREVLAFCPHANVGVPVPAHDLNDENMDTTDLRWVMIDDAVGNNQNVYDGDWILKGVTGDYFVRSWREFEEIYEEVPQSELTSDLWGRMDELLERGANALYEAIHMPSTGSGEDRARYLIQCALRDAALYAEARGAWKRAEAEAL